MANKKKQEKVAVIRMERVALAELARLPGINPNSMSEHEYQALKNALANESIGYLQPITVMQDDSGDRVLVNGEHRVKALIEAGFTHADASIAPSSNGRLLRLSLNLHGMNDESLVADELKAMLDTGYSHADIVGHTHFALEDLDFLVNQDSGSLLDLSTDTSKPLNTIEQSYQDSKDANERPLTDESTFNLTLRFSSKTDRDRVSQTFRQHGVTQEDGALVLLGLK